jgi:biotin-dependent carboxylase-like uncharacterized protein
VGLHILNPGHFTTIQDTGRPNYRSRGVPVGGAFDAGSAALANALLGNPASDATLEMTLVGGVYEAQNSLALALAGAPMSASILGEDQRVRELTIPTSCTLLAGETLRLGGTPVGVRTYLAVRGGWKTPMILGSRSSETRAEAGTLLPAEPGAVPIRHPGGTSPAHDTDPTIRVVPGIDAPGAGQLEEWLDAEFVVGRHADRMGLRLEGPPVDSGAVPSRLSTPVAPGGIQLVGGQLLVLGVACGTMGGYPLIAHVISADRDRLGQLRPGDRVRFEPIGVGEARSIDRETRARRSEQLRRVAAIAADPVTSPRT